VGDAGLRFGRSGLLVRLLAVRLGRRLAALGLLVSLGGLGRVGLGLAAFGLAAFGLGLLLGLGGLGPRRGLGLGGAGRFGSRSAGLELVAALEALDPTRGIHELLTTRVEGVALGADFNRERAPRRGSLVNGTASAGDGRKFVVGVDASFGHGAVFLRNTRGR
jgi:hypothetical protein